MDDYTCTSLCCYAIGTWRLNKVKLLDDGVTTREHVVVPECVHTVTVEWFSSDYDHHVSNKLYS